MAKKKKTRRDTAEIARSIVEQVTGGKLTGEPLDEDEPEQLSKAAEAGRKGGLKGGKARAEKLSEEERREIAQKAAAARWENRTK
ncbi:MAG: histone H1 [Phycisphaerales bacterium]|nr:histone H1 [Phycisphaerales bacterium]MCB9862302.1 histone H1 [Phycisphaerales bacterium]